MMCIHVYIYIYIYIYILYTHLCIVIVLLVLRRLAHHGALFHGVPARIKHLAVGFRKLGSLEDLNL